MRVPPRCVSNQVVCLEAFQKVLHQFDKLASLTDVKHAMLVVWAFKTHPTNLPAVFEGLLSSDCDVAGVMHHEGNACSVVRRRTKVRKPIRIHVGATDSEVYVLKKGKGHTKNGSGLLWDVLSG